MKRIGVLIDRFNVGGVEKIAIEQVKALREIGQDAVLLVLRRKGVIDDAFLDLRRNVPTIYLDDRLSRLQRFSFRFPVFHFFAFFHITYPIFIPFVVGLHEFDHIICHGTYTAFTGITISRFRKIPISTFIWDPISYVIGRVYKGKFSLFFPLIVMAATLLDRWIISQSKYILVGGNAHDRFLRRMSARIRHIYPSVYSAKSFTSEKNDTVLMVTAWKRAKNPDYVFSLVKRIPDIKIVMVGKWLDVGFLNEFNKMIKQHGYRKNIQVVGSVTEKKLQQYYKKCLLFLQTNDDRGFGLPALEAAGNGATFIIPKSQGVCKLFTHGKEGYFVSEHDTDQIVRYLKLLISRRKDTINMGKEAWKTVKNHYNWHHHAMKLAWVTMH